MPLMKNGKRLMHELRMLIAETLINWAFSIMPRQHPDAAIWARYMGLAVDVIKVRHHA
jgi:hypothetical protein